MSDCDNNELDDRLLELNNWQIEQQIKLKKFQEAQRKLLDSEHEKILNSLKTQNYEQRHAISEEDLHYNIPQIENESETQNKRANANFMLDLKSDKIQLRDPNVNLCSVYELPQCEKSEDLLHFSNCVNDYEESEIQKPKTFLRRGDGLARFRMTLDDFKTPPDIYKERRIKTYLNQKPEFSRKKCQMKVGKLANEIGKMKKPAISNNKTRTVPVNIYVSDNKSKSVKSNCDAKAARGSYPKTKEVPKTPARMLTLKPVQSYSRNCTEKSDIEKPMPKLQQKSSENDNIDKQIKKDERELEMFEMLEGRIVNGGLSPNSSLVARFMEESLCSTPSKPGEDMDIAYSYLESLRALQRQYLTSEQIERIQECSEKYTSDGSHSDDIKIDDKMIVSSSDDITGLNIMEEDKTNEKDDIIHELELEKCGNDESSNVKIQLPHSYNTNKTVLQEYIDNFKTLKNEIKENCFQDCDEVDDCTERNSMEEVHSHNQREIALKLQRKALQDNVKNLLNWEGQPRKKTTRKTSKRPRIKSLKLDKPKKLENMDDEKLILNSTLLKERLLELEKEMEIFKKKNKVLTQLQRECDAEKSKLERERKEFERYMDEEKEKFTTKMSEEHKKLQRDKNAFDKYCKQIKNNPNKKEREEITNLKKEVERLTEAMSTKESRWGASQARLRNQIKSLEKENQDLKGEIAKMKKNTVKKVTFEGGKNINTKIIHAINSELGKLKPHIVRNGSAKPKHQSLTARAANDVEKPMRRIKSVPDLKKSSGKEIFEEYDFLDSPNSANNGQTKFHYLFNESDVRKSPPDSPVPQETEVPSDKATGISPSSVWKKTEKTSECTDSGEERKKTNTKGGADLMESVLLETFFENRDRGDFVSTSGTISEIKKRLEKLNLLHHSEPFNSESGKDEDVSPVSYRPLCKSHGSCESGDDDSHDEDDARNSTTKLCLNYGNNHDEYQWTNSTCLNYHCQTKVDPKGVREKKFDDGRREIIYPNGNVKKISADARIVKMIYYNGDLKETDVTEGSEKYYYAETKTWHTTYKDGLEVLEFPNGQTERRHRDGSTEILFPNGCIRYCDSSGKDEWRFLDGTVIKTDKNGHKVLLLPNGQKEIHTNEYKRREYPDGTVKLLYADGTQETRYATGRVRLKDKDGNLVMDSGGIS